MIKLKIHILVFLFCIASFQVFSQNFTKEEIKAAYIIKFTKFIKWQQNKLIANNYVLGIYGSDPFDKVIKNILSVSPVNKENWLIVHYENIEQIKDCNILYINTTNQDDINAILKKLSNTPILTIGDNIPYFCERGGIINFIDNSQTKYKFQINNVSAKNKGLIIDSRLLAISKLINSPGY